MRQFQTSATRQDIDQAAKYIGAGAATVGVAGSGACLNLIVFLRCKWTGSRSERVRLEGTPHNFIFLLNSWNFVICNKKSWKIGIKPGKSI